MIMGVRAAMIAGAMSTAFGFVVQHTGELVGRGVAKPTLVRFELAPLSFRSRFEAEALQKRDREVPAPPQQKQEQAPAPEKIRVVHMETRNRGHHQACHRVYFTRHHHRYWHCQR